MEMATNHRIHRRPRELRLFSWVGCAFFFAAGIWVHFNPNPNDPNAAYSIPSLLAMSAICGVFVWIAEWRIETDETGITNVKPGLKAVRLAWSDIREIRERPSMQCLELHGPPGERTVRVSFLVGDFLRLRNAIKGNCAHLEQSNDQVLTEENIVCRNGGQIFALGLCGFFILAGFVAAFFGEIIAGILFALVGIYGLWETKWHTLVVDRDHLLLKAAVRTRRICYSEICDVSLDRSTIRVHGIPVGLDLTIIVSLNDATNVPLVFGFPGGIDFVASTIRQRLSNPRPKLSKSIEVET